MSEIEVDLIQFIGGPHRGEHAVMVEYAPVIAIFSLDGHEIMQWNSNELGLDGSEWTLEIQCANEWIETNPWKFVEANCDELKNCVQRIASDFDGTKPVVIGTNAPPKSASEAVSSTDVPKPMDADASKGPADESASGCSRRQCADDR